MNSSVSIFEIQLYARATETVVRQEFFGLIQIFYQLGGFLAIIYLAAGLLGLVFGTIYAILLIRDISFENHEQVETQK